ncbi:hypothetical protein NHX12_026422 [Muraenolepis orangiensis]|uniref:Knl1 C-terminal RWD domain-containing protein n=1 Tax=Muraenolepis orangiensis TaxID=630683 RepID=A0A9Q0EHG8_9TELE|nr:hypothetical protein NHX12_026422 [Muraenolepis orangiensis]
MGDHETEDHYGEKTMVFSAEDASMDVTHSHTVIIANDLDLPDQHGERLSTSKGDALKDMDFFFPVVLEKAEPCILPKTTSSSTHSFDPEFVNLLASFSKPSQPRDNAVLHKVEQHAPTKPHDKENQAPTFRSTTRENLPHKTAKIAESSTRGVVLSEDTQGMELTSVFTGHMRNAADDPLQCLFPPLDLYQRSEHRETAEQKSRQRSLPNPNDARITTKISGADSKKNRLGVQSPKMGNTTNLRFTQTCTLPENRQISQNKNALGLETYANGNTAESDDMDMTRSQTVAVDCRSLHAVTTLTKQQQEISRFSISAPYKPSEDFGNDMDFTMCQTAVIEANNLDVSKPSLSVNAERSVRIMADDQRDRAVNQGNVTIVNSAFDDMEITQSQTAAIESLHRVEPLQIKQISQDIVTPSTTWNNPLVDDDMEFTTCHTRVFETKGVHVPIGHVGILGFNKRFSLESDDMEMTKSQTVAIDAKSLNAAIGTLQNKKHAFMPAVTKAWIQNTSQEEDAMEMTKVHSNTVLLSEDAMGKGTCQREGFEHYNYESDEMEMTKCQTVAIDAKFLNAVNPSENKRQKSLAFKTTIDHKSGLSMPGKPLGSFFSKTEPAVDTDTQTRPMIGLRQDLDRSQTRPIEVKPQTFLEDTRTMEREGLEQYNCESDDMEITKCQTVSIDAKNLKAVDLLQNKKRKSLAFVAACAKVHTAPEDGYGEDNIHTNTEADSDMEFTRCQTRLIETKHLAFVKPSLKISSGRSFPTLDSSRHLPISINAVEDTTKGSYVTNSLPEANQENGRHTLCSDDMELTRSQTVALNCKSTGISNTLFHKARKSQPVSKEKSADMDVKGLHVISSESRNPEELDITRSHTVAIESMDVRSRDDASLKHSQVTGPLDRLSTSHSGSAGECGVDPKSRSHGLTDLGDMELTRSGTILIKSNQEETTTSTAMSLDSKVTKVCDLTDRLDPLQNALKSIPLSVDKWNAQTCGASSESTAMQTKTGSECEPRQDYSPLSGVLERGSCVNAAVEGVDNTCSTKTRRMSLVDLQFKLRLMSRQLNEPTEKLAVDDCDAPLSHPKSASEGISDKTQLLTSPQRNPKTQMTDDTEYTQTEQFAEVDQPCATAPLTVNRKSLTSRLSLGNVLPKLPKKTPQKIKPADPNKISRSGRTSVEEPGNQIISNVTHEMSGSMIDDIVFEVLPNISSEGDLSESSVTSEHGSPLQESVVQGTSEEFGELSPRHPIVTQGKRRPSPVDGEDTTVAEKRRRPTSNTTIEMLASHLDHTPEDLLINRHINHPKQRVYESDHQHLAEKVERLKARMKDQGRHMHSVNKPLWEELICFSNEDANLDEQQKLREKREEADGMLKSLDDCIQELEAELAAVEGSELQNVTTELADNERQMHEMEVQKQCNMDQVKRLQTEIQDLNGHITMLHRVNEWKVAERRDNHDVYSFLYGSLRVEVAFDTCAAGRKKTTRRSKGPEENNGRNTLDVNFKLALDEEKSTCHARLVHTLLSEFIRGRSDWVATYPSHRYVPKLLHDVGLVVGRCRLLGEEVHRLRTWGALKFNILDIRCVDTRVHMVFSSLEAMAKFELSLEVTVAYPCCPLQMQDFRSHIGSTVAHRVEEIVSTVSPGKNYLTNIVKAIHGALLS